MSEIYDKIIYGIEIILIIQEYTVYGLMALHRPTNYLYTKNLNLLYLSIYDWFLFLK